MSCAFLRRPDLVPNLRTSYAQYGKWTSSSPPFVYSDHYNTRAMGFQRFYRFDTCKFEKIVGLLEKNGLFKRTELAEPGAVTEAQLLDVHTSEYLNRLRSDRVYLCKAMELSLSWLPTWLLRRVFTTSSYYHASGTILAMGLAIERGWAINIGGGMHHARYNHGEGFCFFADAILGIRAIRKETNNKIQKVLYLDADVHQGNGVARDKINFNDTDIFILDIHNVDIWPKDHFAKKAIDLAVELHNGMEDEEYLNQLKAALAETKKGFNADLLVYNAGTDILIGDSLGLLKVSPQGVIERDQIVFQFASENKIPIVMMTSGGYTKITDKVIANSILNLASTFNLTASSEA